MLPTTYCTATGAVYFDVSPTARIALTVGYWKENGEVVAMLSTYLKLNDGTYGRRMREPCTSVHVRSMTKQSKAALAGCKHAATLQIEEEDGPVWDAFLRQKAAIDAEDAAAIETIKAAMQANPFPPDPQCP